MSALSTFRCCCFSLRSRMMTMASKFSSRCLFALSAFHFSIGWLEKLRREKCKMFEQMCDDIKGKHSIALLASCRSNRHQKKKKTGKNTTMASRVNAWKKEILFPTECETNTKRKNEEEEIGKCLHSIFYLLVALLFVAVECEMCSVRSCVRARFFLSIEFSFSVSFTHKIYGFDEIY